MVTRRKKSGGEIDLKGRQAQAETELEPIAKEINERLERADKADRQADDHRLAAALRLAEAKGVCKVKRLPFKRWVADNIERSYTECSRLATIGEAPDPPKALADMRSGIAARSRKHRASKKEGEGRPAARGRTVQTAADDPYLGALDYAQGLPDERAVDFAREVANGHGFEVVAADEARAIADARYEGDTSLAGIKRAIAALRPDQWRLLLVFVSDLWEGHQVQVARDESAEQADLLAVPPELDKRRKRKRAA